VWLVPEERADLERLLLAERQRGRLEGLEEAAELCTEHAGWLRSGNAWALAEAIRSLKDKQP